MHCLPIDSLKNTVLDNLRVGNLVVEAETGSGKSTRLPLWASQIGRVLVIEPRRIACTSLALFLAEQSGLGLGKQIGYAIKLDQKFDEKTEIVFVTPGIALRWYSENQLTDFDVIIVDEFHERRWDIDLLVALLNTEQHRSNYSHRVVITSATIEGGKLARYVKAQRLQAQGRNFHVSLQHVATESRQLPDIRRLESRVKQEVERLSLELEGDILVFLPGRKEINACQQALAGLDRLIVPLHASVSEQERQWALNIQPQPKVVLATNVAETSLTIPNIVAVVDSGLERRTEQRNGRTALSLKHISKASAKQRMGRAGRVMDGVCVRLYGEHAALSEVTPPELQRESLTEAMLAAASCGAALNQLAFIDPLPEKSLRQATDILRAMDAIDDNGLATAHGHLIYPLPIDALYADLVTRMPTKALREAMVDLTAVLATPANFYRCTGDEEAQLRLEQQEPLGCDGQLSIRLLRGDEFDGVVVDQDVMKEAQALSQQMRELFELPRLSVASRYRHADLILAIGSLHPELVFVRREKRREAFANGELEVILGRDSRFKSQSEAALVLDTHSVPGRGVKQTLTLATRVMPIPLEMIEKIGLGEWQQGEATVIGDETFVELSLLYAGRKILTRQQEAQGELAIKPMIEAVKANSLLPGLYQQREKEIRHWKLWIELGECEELVDHDDLTFEYWFGEQLALLELTDMDELMLFECDDFMFDGIPDWQYMDFAERFPLELALGDLNLSVEYFAKKKLIYVVYQNGLRKGDPKRWELPRWSGWRIQYKKASRILDIK
ncbi:ATP-dependent RNA helicase [Vibrio sinensis]|uniref:ATP-dependent RNA helicase n=1 Tax=Vibrio sinensis TaxID=2302434 RepID=A0A3A6QGF7_9VIBR|nr:helicase-related protein [Vibrio sinensis]RJX69552.1 ATP-dependent RNA helicase [Vibrio sinensis]